jgi:hypothetical protein
MEGKLKELLSAIKTDGKCSSTSQPQDSTLKGELEELFHKALMEKMQIRRTSPIATGPVSETPELRQWADNPAYEAETFISSVIEIYNPLLKLVIGFL